MIINDVAVEENIDEDTGVSFYTYFSCVCKEKDKEFWDKALAEYTGPATPYTVSQLVMDLTHNYHACINSISTDMWFGISLSAGYGSWNSTESKFIYEKECELYIQCDFIEHGLLAAIMILKELGYE